MSIFLLCDFPKAVGRENEKKMMKKEEEERKGKEEHP